MESISMPRAGFQAPDFSLETLDGEVITLTDLRGQPLLINFWTSWCPPCRAEMPALQKTFEDYRERGYLVLGVNSSHQDSILEATAFARENQLSFPLLWDYQGEVSNLYQVQALPTSFFVDPSGKISEVVIGGPMAEAMLRIRIERLLAEQP